MAAAPVQVDQGVLEKKPPVKAAETIGRPVRLKIPRLRVDAAIGAVGLMPDGTMGVPKRPRDTAWYKLGPKPGEVGSAVIAGHLNWWYGAIGVFARLKSLKVGDTVMVYDEHGQVTTFVVRESRWYTAAADAADVFGSDDGTAHLNLVTCDGVWNKLLRQYSKRWVVFTDRVVEGESIPEKKRP